MSRTFDYDTHTLKFAKRKAMLRRPLDGRWRYVDYEWANRWYTTGTGDFTRWYREYGSPKKNMPRRSSTSSSSSRSRSRGRSMALDITPSRRGRSVSRTPGGQSVSSVLGDFAAAYATPENLISAAKSVYEYAESLKGKNPFVGGTRPSPRTHKMMKRTLKGQSKQYANTSTGIYAGRFKKPTKKGARSLENYLLQNGYHTTIEIYGDMNDDHALYLGHSTYNQTQIAEAVTGALFRKLLQKAGFTVTSLDEILHLNRSPTPGGDSIGWRIVYRELNPLDGAIAETSYLTIAGETIKTLIANTSIAQIFVTMMRNNTGNYDPYEFVLYSPEENSGTTHWRLAASMNLQQEKAEIYCMSTMVLQNRTKGANSAAGEFDAERVDNQPLRGYLYEFKGGDPRLKGVVGAVSVGTRDNALNRIRADGLVFAKPPGFGSLPQEYEEPPVPGKFSNCLKASKIVLQPGQMKKTVVTHKYSGFLLNLFQKLRNKYFATISSTGYSSGAPGKCQLFGLEEFIRTDSTNLITCQWEKELRIGCVLKTKKKKVQFNSQFLTYSVST